MPGAKKNFFLAMFMLMFEKEIGQKPGKSSSDGRARLRNRSGVVELVGREPLMSAKVENSVTKLCQFFRRKNIYIGKTQFWPENFHFFEQDRLLFARVEIGVTEFPAKRANKEETKKNGSEIFFSKVGVRIPFSVGNFQFCGRGKTNFWGGHTSKPASQ